MKVTASRRWELVQIYLNMGLAVSARECLESGVCATYARIKAGELGFHFPRPKAAPPPVSRMNTRDPRWARAIAMGAVLA